MRCTFLTLIHFSPLTTESLIAPYIQFRLLFIPVSARLRFKIARARTKRSLSFILRKSCTQFVSELMRNRYVAVTLSVHFFTICSNSMCEHFNVGR